MICEEVLNGVPELVSAELVAATAQNGPFHSLHEGYAVLLEEWEEAEEQRRLAEGAFARLWDCIRYNAGFGEAGNLAWDCEDLAKNAVGEMIQFAAMAKKMRVLCVELEEFEGRMEEETG